MNTTITPDILIHAEGFSTVWMFEPVSEGAKAFFEDSVQFEDWQYFGGKIAVDHRPARDFADYLRAEGFALMSPAYGWFGEAPNPDAQ